MLNYEGAIVAAIRELMDHTPFTPEQLAVAIGRPGNPGSGIGTTSASLAVARMFALPGVISATDSAKSILTSLVGKIASDGRYQLQFADGMFRVTAIELPFREALNNIAREAMAASVVRPDEPAA